MIQYFVVSALLLASILVFLQAIRQCQRQRFYQDTFFLIPFGIFVWGDALILAPVWGIFALLGLFFPVLELVRLVLVFYVFRHAYEVIYWLHQQFTQTKYQAPLFRSEMWIDSNQSAILYQLLNMSAVVLGVWLLIVLSGNSNYLPELK